MVEMKSLICALSIGALTVGWAATEIVGDIPNLEDANIDTFLTEMYGKRPVERPSELSFADLYPPEVFERNPAKGCKRKIDALRKIVVCRYKGPYGEDSFRFTVFIPKAAKGPVPAYVLICNRNPGYNIDPWRDCQSGFWPAEEIVDRGYAAIAFWNDEVAPDCYDKDLAFKAGVFRCFEDPAAPRAPDAWGSLSAWAWGASRIMDWIETEPLLDAKHVAVVGHSRGGKTALLAGVTDKRFAMTVSNCSGCGGAKLNHAKDDASEHIKDFFGYKGAASYWYCGNFEKWIGKDGELPFDQHQWLSLIAPRLLYVACGSEDDSASLGGQKLATDLARPAWGRRCDLDVGFHVREGDHGMTSYDWNKFMDFTDAHGWRQPASERVLADDKLLEELVRVPSVSTDRTKIAECVHFLRRQLESQGLFCRTETMPDGRRVLFAANEDTMAPDVLLSAHLDVVPAQTPDLFKPRWENGVLYGRGASDCKEHCVLAARLMRELKGKVSVGCLFGSDEEIGGESTVFMLDRGYGAKKLVIVLDAEQYAITTRSKGVANFVVTQTAAAGHTGGKKKLKNAIQELMAGYQRLNEIIPETDDGSFRDIMYLANLSGDRERATAAIRVRSPRRGAWDEIEKLVRETVGGTVVCTEKSDPVELDESAPYLNDFLARMRAKWPDRKIGFHHAGGATDARHLQRLGLPMLILGVDASGAHTPDERVIWTSMDEHAELIGLFLKEKYAK